jgi:hypothetical protein
MTDKELGWRFIRARLIGHRMYLKEELQNAIITQGLLDSRRLVSTLTIRVNMDESKASGELVIEFKIFGRFQKIGAGRRSTIQRGITRKLMISAHLSFCI